MKKKDRHKPKYYLEYRRKLKKEIYDLLGNKCTNPYKLRHGDFLEDERCLQIDHVFGDGTKEVKSMKSSQYLKFVRDQIRKGSKRYQLLCANCNWIKRRVNKEGPYL